MTRCGAAFLLQTGCVCCGGTNASQKQLQRRGVQDLARWCWAQDPEERPTFSQIAKYLCLLLEEEHSARSPGGKGVF